MNKLSYLLFCLAYCFLIIGSSGQDVCGKGTQGYTAYYPYLFFNEENVDTGDEKYFIRIAVAAQDSISFTGSPEKKNDSTIQITLDYDCKPQGTDVLNIKKFDLTSLISQLSSNSEGTISVTINPNGCSDTLSSQTNSGFTGSFSAANSSRYYAYAALMKGDDKNYTWNLLYWSGGEEKYWYCSADMMSLDVNGGVNDQDTDFRLMGLEVEKNKCPGKTCGDLLTPEPTSFLALQFPVTFKKGIMEARFTTIVDVNLPDPDVTGTTSEYLDPD